MAGPPPPLGTILVTELPLKTTLVSLDTLLLKDIESNPTNLISQVTMPNLAAIILAQPWQTDGLANGNDLTQLGSLIAKSNNTLADSGFVRMGNNEGGVFWRNAEDTDNVGIIVNASNTLVLSGANGLRLDASSNIFWGTGTANRIFNDEDGFIFDTDGLSYEFSINEISIVSITDDALDMTGNKITNLVAPTSSLGAANKAYVDAITGLNKGSGTGTIFINRTYPTLNFKSILAGTNITIDNNTEEIVINAADEVINSSTALLETTGTAIGTVDFDVIQITGTGIIDETSIATPGVFRLTGNIFHLFSSVAVTPNNADAEARWEQSDTTAFTAGPNTFFIGVVSNSNNVNSPSNAPIATAFVDAVAADVFVRLVTSLIAGSPVIATTGTWGQIFSIGNDVIGGGDVVGPEVSTDRAIAIWSGTGGDTLLDTEIKISSGNDIIMGDWEIKNPTATSFRLVPTTPDISATLQVGPSSSRGMFMGGTESGSDYRGNITALITGSGQNFVSAVLGDAATDSGDSLPLYQIIIENTGGDYVNRPVAFGIQNNVTMLWTVGIDGTVTQSGDLEMGGNTVQDVDGIFFTNVGNTITQDATQIKIQGILDIRLDFADTKSLIISKANTTDLYNFTDANLQLLNGIALQFTKNVPIDGFLTLATDVNDNLTFEGRIVKTRLVNTERFLAAEFTVENGNVEILDDLNITGRIAREGGLELLIYNLQIFPNVENRQFNAIVVIGSEDEPAVTLNVPTSNQVINVPFIAIVPAGSLGIRLKIDNAEGNNTELKFQGNTNSDADSITRLTTMAIS